MSSSAARPLWLARFIAPRHALIDSAIEQWQSVGEADTPASDAHCRMYLACAGPGSTRHIHAAAFAAYGPPVVIACIDWLCERVQDTTVDDVRGIDLQAIEQALALSPRQRYAALLAIDALASALDNLG